MSKETFIRTQQQFFHAVRFFSRPIAALVSRCPDSTMRMNLVHNLAEEQGDFVAAQAHDQTFGSFLQSLGAFPVAVEGPAVRAFNYSLLGTALGAEMEVAFGCLGLIEYAFAAVAALIGRAVVNRGWVATGNLTHYRLHADIDRRHAEEFFRVIEPAWNDESKSQPLIREGLALGHYAFARLYSDLGGNVFQHEHIPSASPA